MHGLHFKGYTPTASPTLSPHFLSLLQFAGLPSSHRSHQPPPLLLRVPLLVSRRRHNTQLPFPGCSLRQQLWCDHFLFSWLSLQCNQSELDLAINSTEATATWTTLSQTKALLSEDVDNMSLASASSESRGHGAITTWLKCRLWALLQVAKQNHCINLLGITASFNFQRLKSNWTNECQVVS